MPLTLKRGNIPIILVLLLGAAVSVLVLAKSLEQSQASVFTAVDSHYENPQISLSKKMDPVAKWDKFENKKYNYVIKFPKQWPASASKENEGELDSYSRFLSTKIVLKVIVTSSEPEVDQAKPTTLGKNTYNFFDSGENLRSATVKHNEMYYTISLTQQNYFADELEFNASFFNILKNFEFTK